MVKDPHAACVRLQRIKITHFDLDCREHMSKPLVTLLDYNPRLTHLEVEFGLFEIDGVSAAVSRLYHLQRLQIQPSGRYDEPIILKPYLLLQSCLALPELTELTFSREVEMHWGHDGRASVVRRLEAIIHEASISRFAYSATAKRIKSVHLPFCSPGNSNPLPLLLLQSNLLDLETCEIPWFCGDATTREIEAVVRKRCPNLKHLNCPEFYDQDGRAARAFIRGCSGLQSFTADNFTDGPDEAPRMMLAALVKYHHTTLEVIELTQSEEVYSSDLQAVLSQCKLLRRFWLMGGCHHQVLSGIAFRDISSSDWVCTELRELGLVLNRCRSGHTFEDLGEEEQQDDPSVWLTASTTKRAYQQIGQLKKLEVLAISIDNSPQTKAKEQDYKWDLTLRKGWLGEWAGLKNLRSLMLLADFWSCMGQEDVEFMHEHWPLLGEIIISADVSEFQAQKHWRWLLGKRPHLSLKKG